MIQFIINWIEFFIVCIIQIKSLFDAAIIINQRENREYVAPGKPLKYKSLIQKEKMKRKEKRRRLPNEILNLIFYHIDNKNDLFSCAQVCKQWLFVISPILWKEVTPIKSLLSCLPAFAQMDINLKTKHTHQLSHYSPYYNLKHYGHFIKSLDLSKISQTVTDCTIKYIAAHCQNLLSLNLSHCRNITDESLQLISRNNRSIQHLILKDCRQISDAGIKSFFKLQTLDLSRCTSISEKGVISSITANGSTLRHLLLNDLHVTSSIVRAIATLCGPRLESLHISRTKAIRHKDIHYLVHNCPNLSCVDFSLKNKKSSSFDQFIRLISQQEIELRLSSTVSQQYNELLQRHVSPRTVSTILRSLKNLKHITLANWHCLDDQSLSTFNEHEQITCLNLFGCQGITQEGLQSLATLNYKRSMTVLHNNCIVFEPSMYESDASSSSFCK